MNPTRTSQTSNLPPPILIPPPPFCFFKGGPPYLLPLMPPFMLPSPIEQTPAKICGIDGCTKSFTQIAHLKVHQRKHTGEKPYKCAFEGCGKAFTQLGNLKTHERRHTGEKPYKCTDCGKAFSQLGNMKTHMLLHAKIKPFQCDFEGCGKSFTQYGNLKSHQLKIHINPKKRRTSSLSHSDDMRSMTDEASDQYEKSHIPPTPDEDKPIELPLDPDFIDELESDEEAENAEDLIGYDDDQEEHEDAEQNLLLKLKAVIHKHTFDS